MNNNTVPTLTVHQLKDLLDQAHICLIDVREPEEWEEMHIAAAHHIPKDHLAEKITAVAPNKDETIYLHCRGGMRSITAAHTLLDLGYKQVYSVAGGIADWEKNGFPVVKSA